VLDDDGEPVYGVWLHPDEYSVPIVFDPGDDPICA
jgi:hypothetical protein